MLVLVAVCLYIFVMIFVAFIAFMLWCKWHDDQLSAAEPAALELCNMLNEDSNVSKLNDMVASSRELVFNARQNYNNTANSLDASFKYFGYLSGQLLNSSRNGAIELEQERRKQLDITREKLLAYAQKFQSVHRSASAFDHVINQTGSRIIEMEVGYVDETGTSPTESRPEHITSNTYQTPNVNEELEQHDIEQGLVDTRSKLYKGSTKAATPGDEDLTFVLSPCAPNVAGQTTPARLLSPNSFRSLGTLVHGGKPTKLQLEQMPTAVRVTIEKTVRAFDHDEKIRATASATSTGAQAAIWEESDTQG